MMRHKDNQYKGNIKQLFRKESVLTIPNLITFFRLCLVPLIPILYLGKQMYGATLAVIVLSGLSDIMDGKIARKFNLVSDFGKVFDPFVDKVTQAAMLVCLVKRFFSMRLLLVLLVIKEMVTGLVGLVQIRTTAKVIQADWHGKLTTSLLYLAAMLHVIWPGIPRAVSHLSVAACAVMMLVAFFHYVRLDILAIREKKAENV